MILKHEILLQSLVPGRNGDTTTIRLVLTTHARTVLEPKAAIYP